jgi:pyruvate dehydrogenase E2 component (dihydrolipoamide acetyltransferase)
MPLVSVNIPQIGEGLQEARVVAFLKKPGDKVRRDEPIYQMETDKAVMDVESPLDGILVSWSAKVDDIVAIGGEIAKFDTSGSTDQFPEIREEKAAVEQTAPLSPRPQGDDLNIASLFVPQIGEGLQEARIVSFLKNPGDEIKRDDPIYQMETDKAVMDVESPYAGKLISWTAKVDDVIAIGAEVGKIQVGSGTTVHDAPSHGVPSVVPTSTPSATQGQGSQTSVRLQGIPPRSRAYAKEKGIAPETLVTVPFAGSKLMPSDIDIFLAGGGTSNVVGASQVSSSGIKFTERQMPGKQRVLNSRMVRSNALVVPGTMTVVTKWGPIEEERTKLKAGGGKFQPSGFTMFAYAVTKAMSEFPAFRSSLAGDDKIRTYDYVSLGIAVSLPGDELVIAVVDSADTFDWKDFASAARDRISLARTGKDQAHEAVTVSLTNMQAFGLRNAIPVVVAPSMATIFLGETFRDIDEAGRLQKVVNVTMTFDHRLCNGVGAAEFLNKVKEYVENIGAILK